MRSNSRHYLPLASFTKKTFETHVPLNKILIQCWRKRQHLMLRQPIKKQFSIKYLLLSSLILPSILLLLLSLATIPKILSNTYQNQQAALVEPLIDQVLRAVQPAWIQQDTLSISETLAALVKRPIVNGVSLTQFSNGKTYESGSMTLGFQYSTQLVISNEMVGKLTISLSPDIANRARSQIFGIIASSFLLALILACMLAKYWRNIFTKISFKALNQWRSFPHTFKPIDIKLKEITDFNCQVKSVYDAKSLGIQSLNEQKTHLDIRDTYFHQMVKENDRACHFQTVETPKNESLTIVGINWINLYEIHKKLSPNELVQLFSQYQKYMHQVAKLYNGVVENHQGQMTLMIFGVLGSDSESAFNALCAGELFLELIYQNNLNQQTLNYPICEFSLSCCSGKAIFYHTRKNNLNSNLTIIGDIVQKCIVLSQHSQQRLLVSKSTLSINANLQSRIQVSNNGNVLTDPLSQPEMTYFIEMFNHPYTDLIQKQAKKILTTDTIQKAV